MSRGFWSGGYFLRAEIKEGRGGSVYIHRCLFGALDAGRGSCCLSGLWLADLPDRINVDLKKRRHRTHSWKRRNPSTLYLERVSDGVQGGV